MSTRTIRGSIVLPSDTPTEICRRLLLEVRDVSRLDAPSLLVAHQQIDNVELEPNRHVEFQIEAPEVKLGHLLSLRVHASLDGSDHVTPGDLLSTASCPISASGEQPHVTVALKRI